MKQTFLNHLKNIPGWKTKRKLIAFAVDDYGNVRVSSKKARKQLDEAGLTKHQTRFDRYDTLETSTDLEQLYAVLKSVKDKNGNSAIFTPYALSCNINFEAIKNNGYTKYEYEELPVTFDRLASENTMEYGNAWNTLKQGIDECLIVPQYHGREHLNLKVFQKKLLERDPELMANLKRQSYTGFSSSGIRNLSYTAAFAFNDESDIPHLYDILVSGIDKFENVYGYKTSSFTPPARAFPPQLDTKLKGLGIKYYDRPFLGKRHFGGGRFKNDFNIMGYNSKLDIYNIVRNVVFEPTDNSSFDSVGHALKLVEAAFYWNKPAILSSHRVNFCGYIDPENRNKGLSDLKLLLDEIVKRWPNVEFVSIPKLGDIMSNDMEI